MSMTDLEHHLVCSPGAGATSTRSELTLIAPAALSEEEKTAQWLFEWCHSREGRVSELL